MTEWWEHTGQRFRRLSIVLATVSCRDPKWSHVASVNGLKAHLARDGIAGECLGGVLEFNEYQCSLLSSGRQAALDYAIEKNATHILWVDDDIEFTDDVLRIMISRRLPVVAVNYLRKGMYRPTFTGTFPDCMLWTVKGEDGNFISSKEKTGTDPCRFAGMGLMLVDVDAIKHIPRPHFEIVWNNITNSYDGEDTYFCRKLYSHDIPMAVDHDASKLVGHIGDFSYNQKVMSYIERD